MVQVVNPTYEERKELKHLNLLIRFYDGKQSSASIMLNDKKTNHVVFFKSFDKYEADAIKIVKDFIKTFDDEKDGLKIEETKKMYFSLINSNW